MGIEEEIDFHLTPEELASYKEVIMEEYSAIISNEEEFIRTDSIPDNQKIQKLNEILDLFVIEGTDGISILKVESLIEIIIIKVLIDKMYLNRNA